MDGFYEPDHMVDGSIRENSMAKIEDVAGPAFCPAEDAFGFPFDQFRGTEKNDGVEVALNRHIVS
jgi:hypothetical protein